MVPHLRYFVTVAAEMHFSESALAGGKRMKSSVN
jgi:hypothetical protein